MNRYIDVEKLIAGIERLKEKAEMRPHATPLEGFECMGKIKLCNELFSLITSLKQEQEQPKFKVGDTIHKIGENTVFPMTIERIYDGDYVCVTEHQQSFISIKSQDDYELVQQEQTESAKDKFVFPKFLYARTLDNKTIDVSYGPQDMTAIEYVRNDFVEQEQPEADLEKEMDKYYGMYRDNNGKTYDTDNNEPCFDWEEDGLAEHKLRLARHFYELGKNARK